MVGLPASVYAAPPEDAPVTDPTPPPLVTAPAEQPPTPPIRRGFSPWRKPRGEEPSGYFVPRLLLGSILGTATGAGGGTLGYFFGDQFGDCNLFDGPCRDPFPIIVATLVGVGTFSSLTVYGVGSVFEGRGDFLYTLLGGAVGTGVGVLMVGAAGYGGILLMPPLAAIGALIAFEVTHSQHWSEPARAPLTRAGLQLVPVMGVTPGGGVLGGLTGRF